MNHILTIDALFPAILSGIGLLVLMGLPFAIRKARQCQHWPSTPGTITKSGIRVERGRIASYWSDISYDYLVNGQGYTGNQIGLTEGGINSPGAAEAMVKPYPAGQEVAVFYNPRNPKEAVLETKFDLWGYVVMGLTGAVFVAAGVLVWMATVD